MRSIIFVSMLMIFATQAKAQYNLQRNYLNNYSERVALDSNHFNNNNVGKKWFVSRYMGMFTSVGFYNGGNATIFATTVGLQLNRKLTNNWYAFAGVSAMPAYIGFNRSFIATNTNKLMQPNSLYSPNNFNLFPKAELGLMYINDQKTFSISGSISVEKSNYYFAPVNQFGTIKPNTFNTFNR